MKWLIILSLFVIGCKPCPEQTETGQSDHIYNLTIEHLAKQNESLKSQIDSLNGLEPKIITKYKIQYEKNKMDTSYSYQLARVREQLTELR